MVIAMNAPSGTATISLEGGLEFTSVKMDSFGPLIVKQCNNHSIIEISNCRDIRIIAGLKGSGIIRMKTSANASMWIRALDNDVNGPAEEGINANQEMTVDILSATEKGDVVTTEC